MSLSGGRESLLTREIVDLKSKLMIETDELNKAIKSNSEVYILHEMHHRIFSWHFIFVRPRIFMPRILKANYKFFAETHA